MLRILVLLLLLANVAFYAWSEGWLDGVVGVRASGDREPERLARQVRPETIRILSASAASEPVAATLACLEAGPFSDAEVPAAQTAIRSGLPGGSWVAVKTERPAVWIVYMGRYADREALNRKEDELGRRKLALEEILNHPTLAPGLSLGRFGERASADRAREQFAQQGIRTARVAELTPRTSSHWLRVEKADAAISAKLASLKSEALGSGFAPCATMSGN